MAEEIGGDVYGKPVRWDVEDLPSTTSRRPDVVLRFAETREVIASGEAKRPDTPKGIHPLVASEIRDALEKAKILGAPICFTTNFFDTAVLDARKRPYPTDLDRLQGGLIGLLPEDLATTSGWWSNLSDSDRQRHARLGLPPSSDDPAFRTYTENSKAVRTTARDWLQKAVRSRLS